MPKPLAKTYNYQQSLTWNVIIIFSVGMVPVLYTSKMTNKLTAVLVGKTQSNISQPKATHTTRSTANLFINNSFR